jgi:hypothetical protein
MSYRRFVSDPKKQLRNRRPVTSAAKMSLFCICESHVNIRLFYKPWKKCSKITDISLVQEQTVTLAI